MDIHVQLGGMQFDEQTYHAAVVAEGVTHDPIQGGVTHSSSIHKEVVASAPGFLLRHQKSPDTTVQTRVLKRLQARGGLTAKAGSDPLLKRDGRKVVDLAAVKRQREGFLRERQGKARERAHDVAVLGPQTAHELQARRSIVKQVSDLDAGPNRCSGLLNGTQFSAFTFDDHSQRSAGRPTQKPQP